MTCTSGRHRGPEKPSQVRSPPIGIVLEGLDQGYLRDPIPGASGIGPSLVLGSLSNPVIA